MADVRYICTKDLYLEKYDEDGFLIGNRYFIVPKDSIWETDNDFYNFIGGKKNIHLDRIWKSKNAKTHQWIEISKETLSEYFVQMK